MFRHIRAISFSVLICAGLTACESTVHEERLPDLTFSHLQAFRLDVASVDVVDRFASPLRAPHIEHLMPVSPAKGLVQWSRDRLKPVGSAGSVRVVIEDARATETPLARDESLKGKFTKQQSHRYDMAVRATLELIDGNGQKVASAGANASRSVTVREDVSLNDRERVWFNTVDQLLRDFDQEIDANVRRYLVRWLR